MKFFLIVVLLACFLHAPAVSRPQSQNEAPLNLTATEIAKLIDECGWQTTRMANRLFDYSFNEVDSDKVFDKKLVLKSEQSKAFEVYPIAIGRRVRFIYVQISENGAPLSAEKIAHQREQAVKQTIELEQKPEATTPANSVYRPRFWSYGIKVEKRRGLSRSVWYIRPTDFLLSHDFSALSRIRIAGRETIVLSFRPHPGYLYDRTNVAYPDGIEDFGGTMAQLGGRIWIDAADKVIVRLEAVPVRELDAPAPATNEEPALLFEFQRQPNGIWVPLTSRYYSYGREDVFWKTPISRTLTYRDYKLFKTTADVEKTEPATAKP